jgi:hypothetical protein
MCLLSLPAQAQETDVGGVRHPASVSVQGTNLQLNGAGIRYKAVFKVYTAGLYLSQKADTPEAVLAATGPKRMHITMLREIDANELGKLFTTRGGRQHPKRRIRQTGAGPHPHGRSIFSAQEADAG